MADIPADSFAAQHAAMARPLVSANPVIPGFHPDPSVCQVGQDYYLACSSFEYWPGVPIFRSRDLRHWEQIGNALERPSQLTLPESVPSSGGIFAPTLRHHDGRLSLVTTNFWGGGNVLFTADKAEGPWSEPVLIGWPSHCDPDLAWDSGGTCYLTVSGIEQARVDTGTGALLEEPRPLWSGTLGFPEAPHLYEIDGTWYLMIAEGGTERGHCISIARSDSPQGPFAGCPANPILTHRSTTDPIQQHPYVRVRTLTEGAGGLVVRMDERHHYAVEVRDGLVRAQARIGGLRQVIGQQPCPPGPVVLRLEVLPPDAVALTDPVTVGPDRIRLGLERGDSFTVLAELDGRYLSTEVTGGFTGRVVGVYAAAGTASFDWLDYEPLPG
jgi:beta-xylosidase